MASTNAIALRLIPSGKVSHKARVARRTAGHKKRRTRCRLRRQGFKLIGDWGSPVGDCGGANVPAKCCCRKPMNVAGAAKKKMGKNPTKKKRQAKRNGNGPSPGSWAATR